MNTATNRLSERSRKISNYEIIEKLGESPQSVVYKGYSVKKPDELLAEVKSDQALKRIPVVVLTSSSAERDVSEAYDLHANCYVTKPVRFDEFARSVKAIQDFWLATAVLPSRLPD